MFYVCLKNSIFCGKLKYKRINGAHTVQGLFVITRICKSEQTLCNSKNANRNIHIRIYMYTNTQIQVYLYAYVCLCVRVLCRFIIVRYRSQQTIRPQWLSRVGLGRLASRGFLDIGINKKRGKTQVPLFSRPLSPLIHLPSLVSYAQLHICEQKSKILSQ